MRAEFDGTIPSQRTSEEVSLNKACNRGGCLRLTSAARSQTDWLLDEWTDGRETKVDVRAKRTGDGKDRMRKIGINAGERKIV